VLRPVAVMAIAVALLSIPLLALLKYARTGDQVVKAPQVSPVAKTSQAPSYEVPKQPFVPVPAAPPEDAIDRPRPMRAVVTDTVETDRPRRIHKPPTARLPEPEPLFHPIGLPERAEDAAIDGRVVRVDMPRSALFALGVDLPLENGTRAVKADLLVGADGIPRGIRLVE
jgi:hypothetical protein